MLLVSLMRKRKKKKALKQNEIRLPRSAETVERVPSQAGGNFKVLAYAFIFKHNGRWVPSFCHGPASAPLTFHLLA